LKTCLPGHRRIGGEYVQLPVADADSVYRERVYCYELYHQLRSVWNGFPFSLGGEVDKMKHPFSENGPYATAKPDLLVHRPGDMDRNLACVEVKRCSRASGDFRDDLKKLTWFCRNARYHGGIFLVYGLEEGETPDYGLLRRKLDRASANNDDIDLGLVRIVHHPTVGQQAQQVNL
jgi:hypothetical protein